MTPLVHRLTAVLGLSAGVVGLLLACSGQPEAHRNLAPTRGPVASLNLAPRVAVAPPLTLDEDGESAFGIAAQVALPERAPTAPEGLHMVYRLSETIVSGAEPESEAGFASLAEMGIKTVISVDGKVPESDLAAKHGIRTVHIPIQYKGFSDDELLRISKTFRELDGPFFVHCFHGVHRGPAAAAIGRLILDGAPREQAMAEMRQWCGTSSKYEGLYRAIAATELPTPEQTEAYAYDFEPAHRVSSLRAGMVNITRHFDMLKLLVKADWGALQDHPDIDALQEATQVHQLVAQVHGLGAEAAWPDDFRTWMDESRLASAELVRALSACSQDGTAGQLAGRLDPEPDPDPVPGWRAQADLAFELLDSSCKACHSVYRN